MTSEAREALREKVADIIRDSTEPTFERIADAAIAVALEEAARLSEKMYRKGQIGSDIAAAIRGMKGKATSPESAAHDADQSPATR
jgi:hypothetical protein